MTPTKAKTLLAGEIVTWGFTATKLSFDRVYAAMDKYNINRKLLRKRLARNAFARACHQMSENRDIRLLEETGTELQFQFTAAVLRSRQYDFQKEAILSVDKKTGKITGDNPAMVQLAKSKMEACMDVLDASDMTALVQRMFMRAGNADLFPIRSQGGAYFVPARFEQFVAQTALLVRDLGGDFTRWPIASGTEEGDRAIRDSVLTGFRSTAAEYAKMITELEASSPKTATLERMAKRLQEYKFKLANYGEVLGAAQSELNKLLGGLNTRLTKYMEAALPVA